MGQPPAGQLAPQPPFLAGRRRPRLPVRWLYVRALLAEFRWTLAALAAAVALGAVLYRVAPPGKDRDNSWATSFYGGWMALVAQPLDNPPATWYLKVLCCTYPVFGFLLLGEGVVRLSLLMVSRRRGEKEWMLVMASTCRDHVILCGLGHLGFRVMEQLRLGGMEVVCIDRNAAGPLVAQAKAMGVPVLAEDMTDDRSLLEAGVGHARTIIAATNNDVANLEVVLDARRVNPKIRVMLRLFDQQLAAKVSGALSLDVAFSASALAAPVIAGLAIGGRVLSASIIAGAEHLLVEVDAAPGGSLVGQPLGAVESRHSVRVVALTPTGKPTQSPPKADATIGAGDRLFVHATVDRLKSLTAAAEAPTRG